MSFQAIAAVLNHSQASPGAKLVLTIIANYDGPEGAFCSQETVAKMANVTPRQIRRYFNELKELGELDIWLHEGKGYVGSRKTNRYYILLDCPPGCDGSMNHRVEADIYDHSGGHIRPMRRTHMAGEADISDRLTYIEPIVNQNKPIKLKSVN